MRPRAWRLVHARWAGVALSGEGARRYPGRWNRAGEPVVYLASSLALAVLETRVHLEVPVVSQPYVALEYELPGAVQELDEPLPESWREDVEYTRRLGSRWLRAGAAAVLKVPSAVVPAESIYLLNPLHPEAAKTRLLRQLEFAWDERLF
ncbi:RES family NAD+ phosphorylase [Oceanithermus sp.]